MSISQGLFPIPHGRSVLAAFALAASCWAALPAFAQCDPQWTQRTTSPSAPPAPTVRGYSGIAHDPVGARVLVYGGSTGNNARADVWSWNDAGWTSLGNGAPGVRKAPAMDFDIARSRLVLFGGAFTPTNDTWEWDGAVWTQVATTGPVLRGFTAMVYDSTNARSVLFGGWSSGFNYFADTWAWNGTAWTQIALVGPSPHTRGFHAMAYDRARAKLVLFGGLWNDATSSNVLNDTWEFDGATWTQLFPASSPAPRAYHAMDYDPSSHRVIMHGGFEIGHGAFDETWAWDGSNWTQLTNVGTPPIARQAFSMAYDATRSQFMVFGGVLGSTYRNDVWTLSLPTCCAADFNTSGTLTVQDIFDFLTAWFASDPRGDFNAASGITVQDIFDFLTAWFAGCA